MGAASQLRGSKPGPGGAVRGGGGGDGLGSPTHLTELFLPFLLRR